MKREHNTNDTTIEPTLWCKFNVNLNDDSPNHYTPYLLFNSQLSYYNNQAIIGAANKCVGYTMDKFSSGDFSYWSRIYRTSNVATAFLFTSEGYMVNGDYPTVNCMFDNNGSLSLMTRLVSRGANYFVWNMLTVPLNEWHDVLLVRKNGFVNAYLDGVLQTSQAFSYGMFTENQMWLNIGNSRSYQYGNRYFRGYIDEIKYWHNTAIML